MNILKLLLFVILLSLSTVTTSQNSKIFIPHEFKQAVSNGTRTMSGRPGKNYWQNSSDYNIKAEILPETSELKGTANITYYNNSPDTLTNIVIRLYQNLLSKGVSRDWSIGAEELTDGVGISLLVIGGDTLIFEDENNGVVISGTNANAYLHDSLFPGRSVDVEVNWSFYIPKIVKVRMGNYGSGELFIAYWYPQIAVYDDIDGWDKINYSGSVEFYNDFNNYDFEIIVPGNYVVWATGTLKNPTEVFQQTVINKIEEAKKSYQSMNIINSEDHEKGLVTINNEKNVWKFKAENINDISFCTSDSYIWDAASVEVEPGRRVLANAVYEDSTIHYDEAAKFSRMTIEYLSKNIPGYPYPYPHVTTFCNGSRGGGMESPMMANNGSPAERVRNLGLIFHEIAHNYFPFIMGNNERKYAWMDEGWASFLPAETVDNLDPEYDYLARRTSSYEVNAGKEADLPPMILSYSNCSKYKRNAHYSRPAIAYNALMELLGKRLFKKATLEYMDRWAGKHPLPYDFFNTFEDITGEDLRWFWKPWFIEMGNPDLGIKSVISTGNEINLTIEKIGNIPTRVKLTFIYDDDSTEEIIKSARVWKEGEPVLNIKHTTEKEIDRIELGGSRIPDSNRKNNVFEFE